MANPIEWMPVKSNQKLQAVSEFLFSTGKDTRSGVALDIDVGHVENTGG